MPVMRCAIKPPCSSFSSLIFYPLGTVIIAHVRGEMVKANLPRYSRRKKVTVPNFANFAGAADSILLHSKAKGDKPRRPVPLILRFKARIRRQCYR